MSAKQYSIAFTLMGQLGSGFLKAFSKAGDCFCELQKSLKATQKEAAANVPAIGDMQKKVEASKTAFEQHGQHVKKLGELMNGTHKPSEAMVRGFQKAKEELDRLEKGYKKNEQALKNLQAAQKSLPELSLKTYQAGMAENKAGALATGMAVSEAFKNIVSTGMDFEQQMARVGAVANIPTQNLGKLTQTAQELGRTTEWSASQAAQGMQYLAMAGFKENQIIQAMPGMLSMATAGHLDLARAADIASNVMSGFGLTADQISRIGDVMAKTTSSANLNMEQFGETMKYVAPVAKAAGVTLEQAAAMAAKLGNAGIQGSDAGTALRAIFARVATTGAKALKQLGVSTKDASGNMRNYQDIIEDLGKKLNALPSGEKLKYLESIFGKNAMSGGAALIAEDKEFGSLKDFEKVLLAAQGTSDKMALQQSETLQGRAKAMQSALEGLKLSVYGAVQPAMTGLTGFATGAINKMNELTEECPVLGNAVGGVMGVIGGLFQVSLPLNNAIQTGKYLLNGYRYAMTNFAIAEKLATVQTLVFSGVQKAWAAVTSFCSGAMATLNAIMAANPVGALIVAFAALIAIGILVWKNWDSIKAAMLEFWQTGVMPVINGLKQAWHGIVDFINGVFKGDWKKAWEGVKNIFGGVFNSLISLAKMPLNAIINMINAVIGGINKLGGIEIAGEKLGINIPKIPLLAQGGIVSKPTLAMIGEGRESEAVLPLSKLSSLLSSVQPQITINPAIQANMPQPQQAETLPLLDKLGKMISGWMRPSVTTETVTNNRTETRTENTTVQRPFDVGAIIKAITGIRLPDINLDAISKALAGFRLPEINMDAVSKVLGGFRLPEINLDGLKSIWDGTLGALFKNFRMPLLPDMAKVQVPVPQVPAPSFTMPQQESRPPEAIQQLNQTVQAKPVSSGEINLTFAPVIHVNGGDGDPYAKVKRGLDEGSRNLKEELERLMADQRRLSFV